MNRYFDVAFKFSVKERVGEFTIRELIGQGASCAVYRADFVDEYGNRTEHLLKEYNPKQINLFRDESGALYLERENDSALFEEGLHHFRAGYVKQLKIRRLAELKNSTSNIQGIYHANNTQYIDMICFNGRTYDKVREKSVYDLLRRMKAVAQVVGNYHKAGYLHLDIKPQNIYTIPETCEIVMLFDFDSVIEKTRIKYERILSYTKSWAAPEQLLPDKHERICEATDLFAIGEMIFHQLMGRHSTREERRSFAKYNFNYQSPIFENVDSKVLCLLEELLHHTICGLAKKRYQSADELIEKLDTIIEYANPSKPYLKSNLPAMQDFFLGRDQEISDIHRKLHENSILFISGIGGIGKSELAKRYADKHRDDYDTIIFAPYINEIEILLQDDNAIPLNNFHSYPEEKPEDYRARRFRKLQELFDERTLLIVDNLDCADDPGIQKLLDLNCNILITTRMDFSEYGFGQQLIVDALDDHKNIRAIFDKHYSKPLSKEDDHCVEQIIKQVMGHTMTVELLAKQMMAGRVSPGKMLERIQKRGLCDTGKEKVCSGKDGVLLTQNAYGHIQTLFSLSKLEDEELYILINLSLIPFSGISTELFHDWCELQDYETVNKLIREGWIQFDSIRDIVSLHPIIGEVLFPVFKQNISKIYCLLGNSIRLIEKDDNEFLEADPRKELANIFLVMAKKLLCLDCESIEYASFLDGAPNAFCIYGDVDIAIACKERALEIKKRLFGEDHKNTAISYVSLAKIYLSVRSIDLAEEYYKKALNIWSRNYGEEYRLNAIIYNDLGEIYRARRDSSRAMEYCWKAIKIREKEYGEDSLQVASSYRNCAVLFKEAGEYSKAEQYYQKALLTMQKLLGSDCVRVASIYRGLGDLQMVQNKLDVAETYFKEALRIDIQYYGVDSHDTSVIYSYLGNLNSKREHYKVAEDFYLKALAILQRLYGDKNLNVITAYRNLCILYKNTGEVDMQERAYQNMLKSMELCYGSAHSKVISAYYSFGEWYQNRNLTLQAEKQYKKIVEMWNHSNDESKKTIMLAYNHLGMIYQEKGTFVLAKEYHQNALLLAEQLFEKSDGQLATYYGNLGVSYRELNCFDEASELLNKALKIRLEAYGSDHMETAVSYSSLGYLYFKQSFFSESEKCYKKALEIRLKKCDGHNKKIETVYRRLAELYETIGRGEDAKACLEKAVNIRKDFM